MFFSYAKVCKVYYICLIWLTDFENLLAGKAILIHFIIWPCLKRTGNKQIQEFDWLKSILTAV